MAHLDLHEQEQVDKLKYFWRDWGKYIIAVIALLVAGYVVSSGYSWYKQSQAQKAVAVYSDFTKNVTAGSKDKAFADVDKLIADMSGTEYASMAAISAAKLAFEAKDYAKAIKYLSWAKDNSSDKSLGTIATIRLANVYIDQNNFDKARELLRTKHDIAFDGLFYEGRGDLYVAMGDLNKARDAYKEGLQKAANDPSTQQAIQMKLDIIGG
ncbi:MAG: tetratricopeptide repeat protein [Proteobacteria bacterium]|nr:MAG: tetratricopeptide repeat protein [Pseudomonadota bacterium]